METNERDQLLYESLSYWHRTSFPFSLNTDLPTYADVVVVGGGILGTATAYWLARSGVEVVLLEKVAFAYGATGRNGGFVSSGVAEPYTKAIEHWGHDVARAVAQITYENRDRLRQVLADEGFVCDYREPGILSLAMSDEQFSEQKCDAAALVADGFDALVLDRRQLQEFIHTPLSDEIVGGTLTPEFGLVHSARLVEGLARSAIKYGAKSCNAKVERLLPENNRVRVQTARGDIVAQEVVVAANAWSSELIPELTDVIVPVRGQMLAYAPVEPIFTTGVGVDFSPTGEYWQQTLDGSIVLGGCRSFAPGWDVGVGSMQSTGEVQSALGEIFPRLFPALCNLQVAQRWAGLMAFTPDNLPIVDNVPRFTNAWLVGGFCGHGMPFGLRLGQLLAETVINHRKAEALLPFHLGRPSLHTNAG